MMQYLLYGLLAVNLGTLVANLVLYFDLKEQLKKARAPQVVWSELAEERLQSIDPRSLYEFEGTN